MGHRLVEHVGEVVLALEAPSAAALFADAVAAFRELVDERAPRGEPFRRAIVLPETEPGLLMVDWLNELLFLAEVEGVVPERVERLDLTDGLRATLVGVRGRPRHLVKAATLNDLDVSNHEGVWRAHVVLDV